MYELIKELTPLNRVFCSKDYDKACELLKETLPFKTYTYSKNHNGWVIPPKWDVKQAYFSKEGKIIFNAKDNPLGVISLSESFQGKVSLNELKKHLHYDTRNPEAIPFHFRQIYRCWERTWGFCIPKKLYDSLTEGEYEVLIKTEESKGYLTVLEYEKKGKTKKTIAFVAHLDHPYMANDDLSGCLVGIELFQRIEKIETKFTYRLLIVPEIMGSEHYLSKNRKNLIEGVFLEMLGTWTDFGLQASLNGNSLMEKMIHNGITRYEPFRKIIGNDEIIWESYNIPMSTITRYPYKEYHSNLDNIHIISKVALAESLHIVLQAIVKLENEPIVFKKFNGVVCVSNPKYDLYIDGGQPAFGEIGNEKIKKLSMLMDIIPTLNKPTMVRELADIVGLPFDMVLKYLKKWEEKGLLEVL